MRRSENRDVPLTARQRELLEQARGVILSVALKLHRQYQTQRLEDLQAWCEDGAIAAAQDYCEAAGGAKFTTFAWSRIWGAGRNGVQREGQPLLAELRDAMGLGRACAGEYAAEQRDTGDLFHDSEEDDQRRPREALDGFAAAYVVGLSMSLPPGTPEAEMLRAEVRAAIATLKERDQSIVTLHLFDRMPFAAIAEQLGGEPSEVTVRRHFHAAMLRLAKRLIKRGSE